MERVEIIVKGDVQRVGYRDAIQRIARDLDIVGSIENIKPYDVRIIAEGDAERLKKFAEAIKIKRYPISVKELDINWESATGEFEYFEIIRGDWQEEIGGRLDTGVHLLYRSVELSEENLAIGRKMLGKQDQMLDKQDQMLDKQDQMLGKQDETIHILKSVKEDTTCISEDTSAIRKDISSLRKVITLEEKYERLSQEVEEIKTSLTR